MSAIPTDQAADLRMLVASHEAGAPHRRPKSRSARVVAVASGKGGVGKTNIAVNLAIRLSQVGHRVVLVDVDLGTANADVLMNVQSPHDLSHVLRGQCSLDEIAIRVNHRLRLIVGASGLTSMTDLSPFERRELVEELVGLEHENDFILLDCGAGISQNVLAFAQAADELLVVTTPEPTSLTDAYALIKVLSQADPTPSMGVVVNQAESVREGRQVGERIVSVAARFLRVPIDCAGQVLRDHHLVEAVRRRVPFVIGYPRCLAATGIAALAERVARPTVSTETGPGFFRRALRIFY